MNLQRGDIVIAAPSGDYGEPRPCLVVQTDLFPHLPSLTVCPLTSELRDDVPLLRINIVPTPENGLRQRGQVAIDKISTMPKARIGQRIGAAEDDVMLQVSRAIAVFLGIG